MDSGSSIGYLIASLIMPALVSSYSWRLHWIVWGVASLLIAALTLIAIPHLRSSMLQSLKYPKRLSFWFTAFSYMLFGMALWVPLTFLVTYGLSEVGLSFWLASMLGVTIAISSIPGKLLLPHVSDIVGRYKIISLSLSFIALSQALYVLMPSTTLIFAYTCLLGLGYGGCTPLYSALATDFSDRAGTILGLWTIFYSIGSMISPKISGMLADLTGSFKIPFIYGSASALISILLIFLAFNYSRKELKINYET
ncbi:MAG: MFS transporter [Candidatus Nezhaarchaeales archaeon]